MAYPVILVDSATGTDTAASGAGPGTALTGTAAATDGVNGKTVTITDAVDLSGVATGGSAALRIIDTTAGARNWDRITGVSGTSGNWTVTVENGFAISLSGKTWAIGGKLASCFSNSGNSLSLRLFNNNSASGDAMPGWTIEMQSGHSETVGGQTIGYRNGDSTTGRITFRGASGATTLPLLTFTNNGVALTPVSTMKLWTIRDFEVRNNNATKTASAFFSSSASQQDLEFIGIKCSHSTDKFWKFISSNGNNLGLIQDCNVGYTVSDGITSQYGLAAIENNYIHDCGGHGITISSTISTYVIIDNNIIANCTSKGINWSSTSSAVCVIKNNTINGNGSDGINIANNAAITAVTVIENNILSNNGGVGLYFSGLSDVLLAGTTGFKSIRGNQTYNNTTNAYKSTTSGYAYNTCPWASEDNNLNPQYTATGSGDYSLGANLKGKAYPVGGTQYVGNASSTYSYADPGASQHQDSGGGSAGMLFIPNLDGV